MLLVSDQSARDDLEEERADLEEEIQEARQSIHRKAVQLQCLEYIQFRLDCEKVVEDQPTMYPETDPLRN